jgi:poly(A) polymerase
MGEVQSPAALLTEGSAALELAERFRAAGHDLYLVGGPVRDFAMGLETSTDVDLATDALPDETLAIVGPVADAVWLQGKEFGTIGARIGDEDYEITTFRTERYLPDSRHPRVDFESDIEVDLSRRDFTVNAMAIKLPGRDRIDPFGGWEDLNRRILRTPIDPELSFTDDPLRMLRAFRFASQLDFRIHEDTLEAITKLRDKLGTVSAERIREELTRLVTGLAPGRALRLADSTGLLELFLPEVSALKLEQDPVHRHKDVFLHTLAVVERAPAGDPVVRLAALLHDIGKPRTRAITNEGVTFHLHEVVGARMARDRLKALRYPNETVYAVTEIIRLHHRFHTYRQGWTDSAVRRYVRDAGALLGRLNGLVRADCTTRDPVKAKRLAARMDELEARISELAKQEQIDRMRPALDGVQIMAFLGVGQGRLIGEAREFLLEIRIDEGEIPVDEAYARLERWAKERGIEVAGARVPPKEKKKD